MMFDERRIESEGLSLAELAVFGCASAILMLLLECLCTIFSGKGFWTPLSDWPTLRNALGVGVGIPVFGLIAKRWLSLNWFGQGIVIIVVIVGLGHLLALAVEALVRWLLSAIG